MKNAAIEVIVFSQTAEIFHRFRTFPGKELTMNVTLVSMNGSTFKEFGNSGLFHDGHFIFMSWFLVKDVSARVVAITSEKQMK